MGKISKPVMAKIATRYGIRQDSFQQLTNGDVLVPITNADDVLTQVVFGDTTVAESGAITRAVFTVPAGKRWRVLGFTAQQVTGTITFTRTRVFDPTATRIVSVRTQTAATPMDWNPNFPFPLSAGQGIFVEGNASVAGNAQYTVMYLEEDMI